MLNQYFKTLYYYWLEICTWHLASIILFTLLLYHLYNIISDLCTKNRQSINHYKKKPSINFHYKSITILSFIILLFYEIMLLLGTLFAWTIIANLSNCLIASKLALIFYTTAKCLMYLILIYRLYIVYKSTAYSHNSKTLVFL